MTVQILIGSLLIGDIPVMLPASEISLARFAPASPRPITDVRPHPSRSSSAPDRVTHFAACSRDLPCALFHPPAAARVMPSGV